MGIMQTFKLPTMSPTVVQALKNKKLTQIPLLKVTLHQPSFTTSGMQMIITRCLPDMMSKSE